MRALAGKIVAITGAGRGLGAAYARLAAEHGAAVLVNDVDAAQAEETAAAIRATGAAAVAEDSDISTWTGAQALVDRCLSAFGGLDAVCNNAGVFAMASPLEQDPPALQRTVEINLLGTAYVGMAAARAMVARGKGGTIVNTVSGAQSGSERMFAYAASKGGVASLTYSWAIDLAPHGIRVNAIAPLAYTRLARSIDPELHHDKPPERVAPAVVYLLSDLSLAVNGQVLFMGGEEMALMSHPAIAMPTLRQSAWTVESIAEAFERELAGRQAPVGRSRQEIKVVMESDRFDVS